MTGFNRGNHLPAALSRVFLKNFKNLVVPDNGLDLNDLNILIGPNGSGKSNFIGVLKFLKRCLTAGDSGLYE